MSHVHLPKVADAGTYVRAGFYPPSGTTFTVCGLTWPPSGYRARIGVARTGGWPPGDGWVAYTDEWHGGDEDKCPECWGLPGEGAQPVHAGRCAPPAASAEK